MIAGEGASSARSASAWSTERDADVAAVGTLAARLYAEYTRMFNEHLTDELRCLYTEDFVMPDRRVMSWEPMRGPEAMIALARSAYETAPDVYTDYEPLFDDGGDVVVYRTKFGGGGTDAPWEMVFDQVTVFRSGLFAHIELFDTAAESESQARFAELRQLVAEGRPLLP
jgi:hypothetical protein